MARPIRALIALSLLAAAAAASFLLPKPKYSSPDVLSQLRVPQSFSYWISRDRASDFNTDDLRYNFISRIFAREYVSRYSERLLLLILDAGNFHNPKVCYGASGYTSLDLPPPEFKIKDRVFKANAVFFEKPGGSVVIVYWIVINKRRVDWTGQKLLQLRYSLFNKEKVGLMVRMDIPCRRESVDQALTTSREFITQLADTLSPGDLDYLFGN